MIWLAWRQSRAATLAACGLLAAFAVLVVASGLHLHDVYRSFGGGAHCEQLCARIEGHDHLLANALAPALLVVPALLGMFWGAPLVAREFETGTYRLAWTQSITRRRWLMLNIAVVGITALAIAGLASWLIDWWYTPLDTVRLDRLSPDIFATRGILVVGYTAFAVALGLAAGALIRRTLPAMAVTLVGFAAALAASTFGLLHHLPFATHTFQRLSSSTAGTGVNFQFASGAAGATVIPRATSLPHGLRLSSSMANAAGRPISTARLHAIVVRACPAFVPAQQRPPGAPTAQSTSAFHACVRQLATHLQERITYQPLSHYWLLQGLVTAIFMASAAALIGLTVWRINGRRTRTPEVDQPRDYPRTLAVLPVTHRERR